MGATIFYGIQVLNGCYLGEYNINKLFAQTDSMPGSVTQVLRLI